MNTFSINRIGLLLRNLWIEQLRYIWIYLCANIILVGFGFIYPDIEPNIIQQFIFLTGLAINQMICFILLMRHMEKHSLEYILIPSTTFEKFSAILLSQLLVFIGYIILFLILNTTYNVAFADFLQMQQPIDKQVWSNSISSSFFVLNPISWLWKQISTSTLKTFYIIQFFTLTAVIAMKLGKKQNRQLRTLAIGIFTIFIILSIGIKTKINITNTPSPSEHIIFQDSIVYMHYLAETPSPETVILACCFCITILTAAYFTLKEKEIL